MKARLTPFIGVALGILVAGSLVLLSLLAQQVTLQPPSSPSVAPVRPWRQPGASVALELPIRPGGSIATLLDQAAGSLRLGRQPNRLLTLAAQAQSEGAESVATTAPSGSGVVVALADGGPGATGPVSEAPVGTGAPPVGTGAPPERPRGPGTDSGGGGPTPSDGDDDYPARRDDEDEEEPPDESDEDDDRDDYAREESDDSDDGSVAVVQKRDQGSDKDDSRGSGSDKDDSAGSGSDSRSGSGSGPGSGSDS